MRRWTKEEDAYLTETYGKLLHIEIAEHLNRPVGAIDYRRRRLHIEAEGNGARMNRLHVEGKHPMQRSEILKQFMGENNPSCREEVKRKISEIKKAEYKNGTAKGGWRGAQTEPTKAEAILLKLLPDYVWNKHIPTGKLRLNYRLDLSNAEKMVCVEVDGSSHKDKEERDRKKNMFLVSNGWTVIRVANDYVYKWAEKVARFVRGSEPKQAELKDRVKHI